MKQEKIREYDLEKRLLDYATMIIRLVEKLSLTYAAKYVGGQLLRSGLSPLFNHGEAESAESIKDFIHKLSICLKELRESKRAVLLIKKVPLAKDVDAVDQVLAETEELICIFVASIRTAKRRLVQE